MATSPSAANAMSDPQPTNTTLRIVILAHGNRAEDDLYLVLGLDTTIDQLKQRIQSGLSYHPSPELQRLIYQGRGLSNGTATLRQILRIDPRNQTSAHVVHLVIRDNAAQLPPSTRPETQQSSIPPTASNQQQLHAQPAQNMPQFDAMRIHNQLHNMQHQMAHQIHHQMMVAQSARMQNMQRTTNAGTSSQASPPTQPPHTPPTGQIEQHRPHLHAQIEVTRVEERRGPNGEIIRTTTTSNGAPGLAFRVPHLNALNTANEMGRSSSAPGSSPVASTDPIHRAVNAMVPNVQLQPQPQVDAQPHPQQHHHHHQAPPPFPLQPMPLPASGILPGMLPLPFLNPMNIHTPTVPSAETMVWLLSSPEGPRGLVFAPGHGIFHSTGQVAQTSTTQNDVVQPQPTPTLPLEQIHTNQNPRIQPQPPTQAQRLVNAPLPAPPQPGALPHPRVQNGPQPGNAQHAGGDRNQENQFVQQVINRGWLFLRLYMFIFVLSETGTWRRNLMLIAATIFCLLPQENPLTTLFAAARRHFDTLIGPPAMPEQHPMLMAPNAGDTNNEQAGSATGSQRGQTLPTPEEAARRLLERQNRDDPNPVISAFRSIEQAVVLFIASLVPDLGERHVEARQQARRANEEAERRLREIAQTTQIASTETGSTANQDDQKPESGPLPSSWETPGPSSGDQGTSTGNEAADRREAHDVRLRSSGS